MPKTINQETENVALNRLKLHPRNANRGEVDAISESIKANGFFGTLVANKRTGHILIGNHRFQVAQVQGFDHIPVTWVDVDDETELRILLADNRTARLGKDDEVQLAELLSELSHSDTGLTGTGFKEVDLEQLLNDLANPLSATNPANNVDDEWQGMPEFDCEGETAFKRILVSFENQNDVNAFAQLIEQNLSDKTKVLWYPYRGKNRNQHLSYEQFE